MGGGMMGVRARHVGWCGGAAVAAGRRAAAGAVLRAAWSSIAQAAAGRAGGVRRRPEPTGGPGGTNNYGFGSLKKQSPRECPQPSPVRNNKCP